MLLDWKTEPKKSLGKLTHNWKNSIKLDPRDVLWIWTEFRWHRKTFSSGL